MVLRPAQVVGAQAGGIEPAVHVTIKGQHGRARVMGREARAPGGVALGIELGEWLGGSISAWISGTVFSRNSSINSLDRLTNCGG